MTAVHVELLPNLITFCGKKPAELGDDMVIMARDWSVEIERVQLADCKECLLKLYMLGDSAKLKLARMGLRVDVRDVDEQNLMEN